MRLSKRECSKPAFFDEVFAKAGELFLALNNGEFPYLFLSTSCAGSGASICTAP